MTRRPKVSIVGAGMVGHTTAHSLAAYEVDDLVLVSIIEKMPMGKALDLTQAAPFRGVDVRITGSNGYEETADSDVGVIIAGFFFSSRRRHTRFDCDWSSDVCSSD